MNILSVGLDKSPLLQHLPSRFLLIDDGAFIDQLDLHRAKHFDVSRHSFNPLKNADKTKIRQLSDIFYAGDPGGENTLTVRNGKRALNRMLFAAPRLDCLTGNLKEPADAEALGLIDNVLFSPVLERVLTGPSNFFFTSRKEGDYHPSLIVARLSRAELGEYDAFLLGNLLIAQYPGTVVIPDFGFYAHKGHMALIRQKRLIAGLNFFDEVPELRNALLTIPTKIASYCTPEDAELLAVYAGHPKGTDGHSTFVKFAIKPTIPESED